MDKVRIVLMQASSIARSLGDAPSITAFGSVCGRPIMFPPRRRRQTRLRQRQKSNVRVRPVDLRQRPRVNLSPNGARQRRTGIPGSAICRGVRAYCQPKPLTNAIMGVSGRHWKFRKLLRPNRGDMRQRAELEPFPTTGASRHCAAIIVVNVPDREQDGTRHARLGAGRLDPRLARQGRADRRRWFTQGVLS